MFKPRTFLKLIICMPLYLPVLGGVNIVMAANDAQIVQATKALTNLVIKDNPQMDELSTRQLVDEVVTQSFKNGDFSSLELMAKELREKDLKTPGGLSKLTLFDSAMSHVFDLQSGDEKFRPMLDKLVQDWLAAYPKSTNAHLADAQMLVGQAWSFRGHGYANTVTPEGWKLFRDYLENARKYLQENTEFADNDPRWDFRLISITGLQDISGDEYLKMVEAALTRHPEYLQLYLRISEGYWPKWGGDWVQFEKFAQKAVVLSHEKLGNSVYARIYWHAAQDNEDGAHILFHDSSISWNEMKLGIDDVLKDYPERWNIYNFAMFACFAGDKDKTHELLARLTNNKIPMSWPYVTDYARCQGFSNGQ